MNLIETDFHYVTNQLVRKLRARLRRTAPINAGNDSNFWCEVLSQMQSDFDHKEFLSLYLNSLIIAMLEARYNETQLLLFWLSTNLSNDYWEQLESENPSINFEEIELPAQFYFTLSDSDKDDLAGIILEQFFYEDNFDLDEENKKGKSISLKYEIGK